MHLLYTDEVNMNSENSEFFVYAGVAIPGDTRQGCQPISMSCANDTGASPAIC
jgi:hypothetical protein